MNANELADNFDTLGRFGDWAEQAQAMLRQQAKEIEELKEIVEGTIKQAFYEDDYYKLKAEYDLLKAVFKYSTLPTSNA